MTKIINNNKTDANIDPRLNEILSDLTKRRIASQASGAALIEKARTLAKRLDKTDTKAKLDAIEKRAFDDLNQATLEEMRSLSEN